MRRMVPGRPRALATLVAMAVMAAMLAHVAAAPTSHKKKARPPKIHETVGDLAYVVSNGEMVVEGVGLVTGLENTGGDSPPSQYRKALIDEMSKAGVEHPERLLASPQLSIVLVRMTIPMGVAPSDPIDVQVEVPPNCPTKSLAGGYLLTARLFRVSYNNKGETLKDHELAIANGPVMVGTAAKPNNLKVGRVLGGGRVKKEHPYMLVIRENRESYYTAKMLESVINQRFHQTEDGHQKGVATGKTASYLVLRVPELYHQNQQRYFRVVQSLPMIDGPELRATRQADWSKELLDPKTAGLAALKLEGLGTTAADSLKEGLKSSHPQVRFFSAEALAYLNDTSGVEVLGEAVIRQADFRAYALAALASLDQSASHMKLRKLMDEPDIEIRYGAFNALRTLDPNDAYLGRARVLKDSKPDDDADRAGDSMAMEIATSSRLRNRRNDPFSLYIVDSEGPPLVHVSRTRRTEIVIFGRQQKLLTPIVLDGGEILINASDDDDKVELSKIVASRGGDSDAKVTTSLELAEVVRQAANLGATYPQIVGILEKANKQRNLPGQLVVDAVPASSPVYLDAIMGRDLHAKRDPSVSRTAAETDRPRWRRLMGLFNREQDTNPAPAPSPAAPVTARRPAAGTGPDDPDLPPLPGELASPVAGTGATAPGVAQPGSSGGPGGPTAAKKDEAVQQTSTTATNPAAESAPPPPPPRRRLFDFFRRSDDDD
jgi:flagellar basal body P-ring protein FlgI